MRPLMLRVCVALVLGIAAVPLGAQSQRCDSAVQVQTDSLRAETQRRSTTGALLSPRGTVVRRLATRIDSLAASVACKQAAPQPPANQPPLASFAYSCTPLEGSPTNVHNCTLDASASRDPDGSITSYAWTWPGKNDRTGVIRDYPSVPGTYTGVTLTVTDDKGATGTSTQTVVIGTPPDSMPVDSVEFVGFDYFTEGIWPNGVAVFPAGQASVLVCAQIKTRTGTVYLGDPAIRVLFHSNDSLSFGSIATVSPTQLRQDCSAVWPAGTLTSAMPILTVQWTAIKLEQFTTPIPVPRAVLP